MPRTRILAVVAALASATCAAPAAAHEGNPNYRSTVTSAPPARGVEVQVVNLDDSLELTNRSRETVIAEGYDGEPYVRIKPDGTVEVNQNSVATYINDERDGSGTVPPNASRDAAPAWKLIDRTGRYTWHDHRIHYMGEGRPPTVTDPDVETKAFDWKVPFRVGERTTAVAGTLTWVPSAAGGASPVAFGALGLLALLGAGSAVLVRRRRASRDDDAPAEAW